MSHDLVSLTMIVIGMADAERELWRQAAAMSSIPVDLSLCDATAGIAALGNGGVDICILDGALPEPVRAAALASIKAQKPAPHVFVCARQNHPRAAGVTAVFDKPADFEETRQIVERCLRTKMPTRVLIVDDSGTMRSIVRKILSASRFLLDMHEAGEGLAALERLRRESFGIVFLDYNMPGLDGLATLSEIKRETPDVAVVMMTTAVEEPVAERAMTAGAFGFLKKPFYPADIDRVLDRYYGFSPA
ncbi:MAG: response regulator [Proteobacteria bacterium]|nr:response regulator [Pseudomonadota bacterium]